MKIIGLKYHYKNFDKKVDVFGKEKTNIQLRMIFICG